LIEELKRIKKNKVYILTLIEGMLLGMPFTIFGILIPVMSSDLELTPSFMGTVLSMNSLSCFIAVVIAGNLIELFGIKRVILLSNFFLMVGMIMIALTHGDILFAFSYFITGFGVGGLGIALNSLTSSIYEKQRSKRLLYLGSVMFIGAILGALSTRIILTLEKSWKYCFLIVGILFFVLLIVVFRIDLSDFRIRASYNIRTFLKMYKGVFLNKRLIIMGAIVFLHDGAVVIFNNWFTTYFEGLNVTVATSALFLILYSISEIGGLLLKAHLIKFWSESKVIIVKAGIALACFVGLILSRNILIKILLIAGIGISSTGLFMLVSSLGVGLNKESSGIVLSYIYSNAYIGSMVFLYISGLFIDIFSHTSVLYICLFAWILLILFSIVNIRLERKQLKNDQTKYIKI
jgi:fucose permease